MRRTPEPQSTRDADADFVQRARELAEATGKETGFYLAKGHKEVSRLYELHKQNAFEKEQNELLKYIPPEFHSVVRSMAWDKGHSSGYREVLNYVSEYVDSLAEPIEAYTERIKNEH